MAEWRAVTIEQASTYADPPIIFSSFELVTDVKRAPLPSRDLVRIEVRY